MFRPAYTDRLKRKTDRQINPMAFYGFLFVVALFFGVLFAAHIF